jgi:hypothetical protein
MMVGTDTINIVSTVNFFLDIIAFLHPQIVIWRLHTSYKRKLGVASLFAFGILYFAPGLLQAFPSNS